jgi:hypothetical protein
MTDAEASEMLARLTEHFREPVLPLSKVCSAVGDTFRCWQEEVARNPHSWMKERAPHLQQILTDIRKSALMGRLVYDGQKVRTKMCPIHHGKQDMHIHLGVEPQCFHECDGTGWLREP